METFSFNPPINLSEEGKWLLAVTSFEPTISNFDITNERIVFQVLHQVIGTPKMVKNLLTNQKLY